MGLSNSSEGTGSGADAGSIRLVPASVVGGIRGQRSHGGHFGFLQFVSDVGADCFRNFVECGSVSAVHAEKIAHTDIGHVSHVGDAAFDTSIVPVVTKPSSMLQ